MRPLERIPSLIIFLSAALLLWIQTHLTIPYLSQTTGHEPVLYWFLIGGLGVFFPLIILAWILLIKKDAFKNRRWGVSRLFFRGMNKSDWFWTIGSIMVIGLLSAALLKGLQIVYGPINHNPPFMRFIPPESRQLEFLALWFPYWILNIMGEEILWRGVMLPRQEMVLGRLAWLVAWYRMVNFSYRLWVETFDHYAPDPFCSAFCRPKTQKHMDRSNNPRCHQWAQFYRHNLGLALTTNCHRTQSAFAQSMRSKPRLNMPLSTNGTVRSSTGSL